MKRRRRSVLTWTPCLSVFLMLLLIGVFVGHVSAAAYTLEENVMITVHADTGIVEVSSYESYSPVNNTSPLHTPSGVNVTSMNQNDLKDVTLTFSTSNSTLLVWALNETASRTIGDAWATILSTGFQTSFVYDSSSGGGIENYKAAGKSSLAQYVQSMLSWCSVADLNGFSSTLVQIAGKPGAYITVEIDPGWTFKIKGVYDTTMPTGSGDHTIDVLSLLGVTSLAPSTYSGYYDYTYLSTIYEASVDVFIISSMGNTVNVSYTSSQPTSLSTVEPPYGVMAPRGWQEYGGAAVSPTFLFQNDSSAANQLSYTFNGTVIPEFPSSTIVALFMVISLAAILATKRFHRRITSQI